MQKLFKSDYDYLTCVFYFDNGLYLSKSLEEMQ